MDRLVDRRLIERMGRFRHPSGKEQGFRHHQQQEVEMKQATAITAEDAVRENHSCV